MAFYGKYDIRRSDIITFLNVFICYFRSRVSFFLSNPYRKIPLTYLQLLDMNKTGKGRLSQCLLMLVERTKWSIYLIQSKRSRYVCNVWQPSKHFQWTQVLNLLLIVKQALLILTCGTIRLHPKSCFKNIYCKVKDRAGPVISYSSKKENPVALVSRTFRLPGTMLNQRNKQLQFYQIWSLVLN